MTIVNRSGPFIPEVEIHVAEQDTRTGVWHYKFTLRDPASSDREYPVDYTGAELDFNDPATLQRLWKTYGLKFDREYGSE
jgi:hypothetical protein